jgi:hypothetical protein
MLGSAELGQAEVGEAPRTAERMVEGDFFKRDEVAEDHCQVAAPLLAQQRIFDWLAETFASV